MENNLDHKIINLYENSNFFKIYGFDFWITTISIILCILLISFIFITNNFNEIRQNWDKERCNPLYLLFAGYINPQPNQTNLEYTAENFKFCNDKFIKKAEKKALTPLYHLGDYLNNIVNTILDTWKSILGSLNLLKGKLLELVQLVINKLIAVLIPVQFMFIKVKDSISKMTSTLVGSIYTFYNLYKVIKLYFLNLIQIIISEVFVVTIIALLVSFGILIALLITWSALNAASLLWPPFTTPLIAVANALWWVIIVPYVIKIGIMIVFDILLWTCLVLLNNFANEIYKDINTPQVPRQPTKISSSDIKTTSDKSTNPLKDNQ